MKDEKNQSVTLRARAKAKEHGADGKLTRVPNAALAAAWKQDDLDLAKQALLDALKATKGFYDRDSKTYQQVPDHAARTAAANVVLNQALGLPVARAEIAVATPFRDRETDLLETAATPSGRRLLLAAGIVTPQWLQQKGLPVDSAKPLPPADGQ